MSTPEKPQPMNIHIDVDNEGKVTIDVIGVPENIAHVMLEMVKHEPAFRAVMEHFVEHVLKNPIVVYDEHPEHNPIETAVDISGEKKKKEKVVN